MNDEQRKQIDALIEAIGKIDAESPPDDWEYYTGMGEYAPYPAEPWRHPPGNRPRNFVDEIDDSNTGDVHSHGWSCGYWQAATELRAANARDALKAMVRYMNALRHVANEAAGVIRERERHDDNFAVAIEGKLALEALQEALDELRKVRDGN